jgi:hypothetical protein
MRHDHQPKQATRASRERTEAMAAACRGPSNIGNRTVDAVHDLARFDGFVGPTSRYFMAEDF